jgi:ATP-dependent DNA ligase
MTTSSVLSILNQLGSTTKRTEKLRILETHKDNQDLKEFFLLSLDPMIKFWIRKIPEYEAGKETVSDLSEGMMMLSFLSSRDYTGYEGISWLRKTLEMVSPEDAKVIERIIQKNPDCGVSSSTVNAIWGDDFIKDFPVMKSADFNEKTIQNIKFPAIGQEKVDGLRCSAILSGNDYVLYTGNGKTIDLQGILENNLNRVFPMRTDSLVLDGELVVLSDSGTILNRSTGNGILNKAVKGTITKEECEKVLFIVFDAIPSTEFFNGKGTTTYQRRFDILCSLVSTLKVPNIKVVETHIVNNIEGAQQLFSKYLEQGSEGIILKDTKSVWENRRSKYSLKFKAVETTSLLCVGTEPGTGKHEGKIGSLNLQSADGLLECNVGTGLKDKDREKGPEEYIGKIIEIGYNAKIKSKVDGAKMSVFLPRFIEIRIDKNEADTIDRIK